MHVLPPVEVLRHLYESNKLQNTNSLTLQFHASQQLCRLCPQLHTMPLSNLLLQHSIDKLVLFHDRQAHKFGRLDFYGIHGSATTTYVLDL
jgi:hypothetical protein